MEMEEDRIQLEQARLTSIKQDEDNRLTAETELDKIKLEIARFEAMSTTQIKCSGFGTYLLYWINPKLSFW